MVSESSCLHFSERFPHGSMAMCRARGSRQLSYYSLESTGGVGHPQVTGLKVSPSDTQSSQLCSDFPCRCKLELLQFGNANWKGNCGLL